MTYCLRLRLTDNHAWGAPQEFPTRRARDVEASFARIIGGFRTHSYELTAAEVRERQRLEAVSGGDRRLTS